MNKIIHLKQLIQISLMTLIKKVKFLKKIYNKIKIFLNKMKVINMQKLFQIILKALKINLNKSYINFMPDHLISVHNLIVLKIKGINFLIQKKFQGEVLLQENLLLYFMVEIENLKLIQDNLRYLKIHPKECY